MKSRWVLKFLGPALFAGAFAGQAATQSAQSAQHEAVQEPIRIALIESFSGAFANTGESVFRNLLWAVERVNARGGVKLPEGSRLLQLQRHDSKGQTEEALAALRAALDGGARFVVQGNSSAVAAAIINALDKHNAREPHASRRAIFLNYSAVEPSLTNELCSFWHFRFDAHADMRMTALMQVLKDDREVEDAAGVYLIGQDYSFGQAVLREAKRQLAQLRPGMRIAGEELHPLGRVKDFLPYAQKIKASGAQAVITGNWGNDLTLLVRAARELGYTGRFYTFYGNALGAPAAIGEAGVGKVIAVADWLPNLPTAESEAFYRAFRTRFPRPEDDYVHMRMQLLVEALAQAIERADSLDAVAVARALERADVSLYGQRGTMRAADHQFQQSLVVGLMARQRKAAEEGVRFDVEGSGYGFRVIRQLTARQAELPHTCAMMRP